MELFWNGVEELSEKKNKKVASVKSENRWEMCVAIVGAKTMGTSGDAWCLAAVQQKASFFGFGVNGATVAGRVSAWLHCS